VTPMMIERGRDTLLERHLRPIMAEADWRKQQRMWAQLLAPGPSSGREIPRAHRLNCLPEVILRPQDLKEIGVPREFLRRLRDEGVLEQSRSDDTP